MTTVTGPQRGTSPGYPAGAAQDRSLEREVLTVRQVFTLAEVIDLRYRAMVLLGVFTSLRWGELVRSFAAFEG